MAKLYFRYGAMNSGKSTALLQAAFNYEERGMRVLLCKPAVDTKGGADVVSRLGARRRVDLLLAPGDDISALVADALHSGGPLACILVDECQFLQPAQAEQLFWLTVTENIPVICYGLRTDFSGRGFPGSTRLLQLAHTIEEMKTVCACGRFVFEGEQVVIDAAAQVEYQSMCPQCYLRQRQRFFEKKSNQTEKNS